METRRRQNFEFANDMSARVFSAALAKRTDVSDIEVKGRIVWWTETSTD